MLSNAEVEKTFKSVSPIYIKFGPVRSGILVSSAARLSTLIAKEYREWTEEQKYPQSEKIRLVFERCHAGVSRLDEASSVDELMQTLQEVKQELGRTNVISHSSPVVEYIVQLQAQFPTLAEQTYSYVFANGELPGVNRSAVLAHAAAMNHLVMSKTTLESTRPNLSDLDTEVDAHRQRFRKATEMYTGAILELERDWDARREETKKIVDSAKASVEELINTTRTAFEVEKDAYEVLMSLKAPMNYWKFVEKRAKRSTALWASVSGLIILALVGVSWVAYVSIPAVEITPDKPYSVSDLLRWFVFTSLLVSVLVFGLRQATKVAFSSLHLARDASERRTLSYLYLTLNRKGQVEQGEDRRIVLNALFSRAETGLLKGESGPVMPAGTVVEKILGRSG